MNTISVKSKLKAFLVLFLPLTIVWSILLWGLAFQQKNVHTTQIESSESNIVNLSHHLFGTMLADRFSDAVVLADALRSGLATHDDREELFRGLAQVFLSLAQNKMLYNQVRYIDRTGMERIRVNWDRQKGGVIVPAADLQSKGNRFYFIQGIAAGESIYVSQFDLNVENNEIELPLKPMIRITYPLRIEGEHTEGLIVLNILGEKIIQLLTAAADNSQGSLYLVNERGQWLKGPSAEMEWRFMYPQRITDSMDMLYPGEWQRIASNEQGQFMSDAGLFSYSTVDSATIDRGFGFGAKKVVAQEVWKVITLVPAKALYPSWWDMVVPMFIIGILIVGALSWYLAASHLRRVMAGHRLAENEKKLNTITNTVQDSIVMVDSAGRAAFWNQAAEKMFGFRAEEVMGKDIHQFIASQKDRAASAQGLKKFSQTGEGRFIGVLREVEAVRKDGTIFPAELNLNAVQIEGQWWSVGVVRDLTEKRQAERN